MLAEWERTASDSCGGDEPEILFYDDQTDMNIYWFVSLIHGAGPTWRNWLSYLNNHLKRKDAVTTLII